jgi:uncharacterized protein
MVDITPLIRSDRMVIQGYKNGVFKISNQLYHTPVIVFPDRVEPWPIHAAQIVESAMDATSAQTELSAGMESIILNHNQIDLLLLGTGSTMQPLHPALKAWFKSQGVRCENMDTGAACRTYNVLLAEGRLVVAALLKFE